jgi:hypothetical protein
VVASFFAPDALYRLSAVARDIDGQGGVITLDVRDIERVQRRSTTRIRIELDVSLAAFDGPGPVRTVTGRTVDLSAGGCRVVTASPFPEGTDPTVAIALPEGPPVLARTSILEARVSPGYCEYRMVFAALEDDDRDRLLALTAA